jgi:hypothetical protein
MRADDLFDLASVARQPADMPDGRQEKIGLATLRWHGAEKGEQLRRSRDGKGELFIEGGCAARLNRSKALVSPGDCSEFIGLWSHGRPFRGGL